MEPLVGELIVEEIAEAVVVAAEAVAVRRNSMTKEHLLTNLYIL